MSWVITGSQKTILGLPQEQILGQPLEGGFFAGYISHTQNGVPTHALVVAPRATGATGTGYTLTTDLQWATAQTSVTGSFSVFDGVENTAALVAAGIVNYPAAQFCVNLNIGGYTDWYLPSQLEAAIAYVNLKPTSQNNTTSPRTNPYAVPRREVAYTQTNPAQTSASAFTSSQESFVASLHWTSTQTSANNATRITFADGGETAASKLTTYAVRAFRRIAL
jgi:hypothetical protein